MHVMFVEYLIDKVGRMTTEKFYRKHYDFHSKLSLWIVPNNLVLPDFMSKLLKTDFRLVRGKLLEVLDNNQHCTFCIFFMTIILHLQRSAGISSRSSFHKLHALLSYLNQWVMSIS